jgi:DnaK suppressor protein
MSGSEMEQLRRALLMQRREIFERLHHFEEDWQALGERDIELEEEAQKADLTSLFDQLDERSKEQIEEIDLALCRIAAGSYGICEECEELIPLKRLEALPYARLCVGCARKYEKKQNRLRPAREVTPCVGLPDDYTGQSDEEVQMAILEHLRNDGRIDLNELGVACRKGMIYLQGALPSEVEHQILLQILTDVMGFVSVIDLLQISELPWEREDRAPGKTPTRLSREELAAYGVEESTEDVFESQEEGSPYTSPDRPPPESE